MRKNQDRKVDPMPFLAEMRYNVALTPDGQYHVQNVVGAMPGQHHVHSEQGYIKWKKNIDKKYIHEEIAEFCPCGLEPGHVQEHDGRAWFNEDYK